MDGNARYVRLTTLGGIARAGDEIMQIVPIEGDLIIEAKIKPSDIGFLKLSLPATIKFDAYDYSIDGVLHGMVKYISADTIAETAQWTEQSYYRVHIRTTAEELNGTGKEHIRLEPGMTATVEVMTGKKSVLQYITRPVTNTISESMGDK
jgi:adhesin transport system membrane fusion protein